MKHRIVLATDSLDPSGLGQHMLTLGTTLAGEFDVLIAAPHSQAGAPFLLAGARAGLRIKAFDAHQPTAFRRWLKAYGADLVHVHAGIGWEGHDLVRAARAVGVPVIRTEHLPDLLTSPVQQAEYRAMLLSVDGRIAVSQAVAQSFRGRGSGRLQVVQNGIAPQQPSRTRQEVRTELGLSPDASLVLTIARLTPQKGHDVLLAAVPAVLERHSSAKFVFVGTGPEQSTIAATAKAAGLSDAVTLLGARTDVPDWLGAADLFVLPSHFEGLPLAVLEAMAAGVPVIATAIGGMAEALGDDYPFLVPPGDAPALAASINAALSDQASAASLAEKNRQRFAHRFEARRMGEQTASIYRSLLSAQTSKAPAYA